MLFPEEESLSGPHSASEAFLLWGQFHKDLLGWFVELGTAVLKQTSAYQLKALKCSYPFRKTLLKGGVKKDSDELQWIVQTWITTHTCRQPLLKSFYSVAAGDRSSFVMNEEESLREGLADFIFAASCCRKSVYLSDCLFHKVPDIDGLCLKGTKLSHIDRYNPHTDMGRVYCC